MSTTNSARAQRRLAAMALTLCAAVMALAALTALPARAQTATGPAVLHVSPDGDDRNPGLDPRRPMRTLAAAAAAARPGDTIELAEGQYAGAVIRTPGRADAWIRLRARAGARVVVQGEGKGPALYFYHRSCDEDRAPGTVCEGLYWEVSGLEVRGSPDGGDDGNTVKIDTPFVRLAGNDLCCARADIVKLVRTADDVEILANRIHHNRARDGANAQGVDIVGADRTRVAFNHVHDIPSIGMYAKGNARGTVFEHNRLERIWSHAIMLGQSTDAHRLVDGPYESYDGIVRDNHMSRVGWSCLATASSSKPFLHNNTCVDTGQRTHGAVLVSNESEVRQRGRGVRIENNLFLSSSALPVIKVLDDALESERDLLMDGNVYARRDGSEPRFTWRALGLEAVSFPRWRGHSRLDAASRMEPASADESPRTVGRAADEATAPCRRPAVAGAREPCPAARVPWSVPAPRAEAASAPGGRP